MDDDALRRALASSLHACQGVFATVEQYALDARMLATQFQDQLGSLHALVSKHRNDVENRRLEARQLDEAMEDILQDVANLTRRCHVLQERNHASEERVAAVGNMCVQKRERLERHTQASQACASLQNIVPSLERSLDLFAKWAGLRLIPIPGRGYQICLTLLDSRQPHRCCSLLLGIDSGKSSYIVSECNPALPDLDALVDQLRRTGKLGRFVRSLRQRFKSLLLAQPTECVAASLESRTAAQVAT